ncbi:MAG: HEAT repeat domain-containing protein [Planctomycetes bacterium]|nr:HEAT repeat domain-containing protein [Planctomycetota bacterium]
MNCGSARENLSAYLTGGLDDSGLQSSLKTHLASCHECATEELRLRKLLSLLDCWQSEKLPAEFDGNFARKLEIAKSRNTTAFRRPRANIIFSAAAVLLLCATGLALWKFFNPAVTPLSGTVHMENNSVSTGPDEKGSILLADKTVIDLTENTSFAMIKESGSSMPAVVLSRGEIILDASKFASADNGLRVCTPFGDITAENNFKFKVKIENAGNGAPSGGYNSAVMLSVFEGRISVKIPKNEFFLDPGEGSVLLKDNAEPVIETNNMPLREQAWEVLKKTTPGGYIGASSAKLMGETNDELAIPALNEIIFDKDPDLPKEDAVYSLMALALNDIGTETAVEILRKALTENPWGSEGYQVGFAAGAALCELKDPQGKKYMTALINGKYGPVGGWKNSAALVLARSGDFTYAKLIFPAIGSISTNDRYFDEPAEMVFRAGHENVRDEIENWINTQIDFELKNPNASMAFLDDGIISVGRMSNKDLSPLLITMVLSENPETLKYKKSAVTALGYSGNKDALQLVKDALETETDWAMQLACAVALKRLGEPGAVDKILEITEEQIGRIKRDNDFFSLFEIADALAEAGGPQAVSLITQKWLNDEKLTGYGGGLVQALGALGKIGSLTELDYLKKYLAHKNNDVRLRAAMGILQILNKNRTVTKRK